MMSKCRVALCQILVGADKAANIATALSSISEAAGAYRANIVALPECFNRQVSGVNWDSLLSPRVAS